MANEMMKQEPILEVEDLELWFRTDYGKFNIVRLGKFNQFVTVFHTDIDTFGHIGDPRIAGSAIQFFRQRRLAEFPTEGVFTPAGTDDQNFFHLLFLPQKVFDIFTNPAQIFH